MERRAGRMCMNTGDGDGCIPKRRRVRILHGPRTSPMTTQGQFQQELEHLNEFSFSGRIAHGPNTPMQYVRVQWRPSFRILTLNCIRVQIQQASQNVERTSVSTRHMEARGHTLVGRLPMTFAVVMVSFRRRSTRIKLFGVVKSVTRIQRQAQTGRIPFAVHQLTPQDLFGRCRVRRKFRLPVKRCRGRRRTSSLHGRCAI